MMDAAQLRRLCEDFRYHDFAINEEVVARIEADVKEYRSRFLTRPAPQLPPERLSELLPLMGWLIYEATWNAVQDVDAAFESLDEDERRKSDTACARIKRLANAARTLVWPEFAPRALGAIRAQALAESKRDTEAGYDAAYIVHQEARDLHASYLDSHGGKALDDPAVIGLDETFLQLALAETGTACRTAERVIGRWSEEFTPSTRDDEARWVQRMYRELTEAVEIGERALGTAKRIKDTHGLVHRVTEERMALVTGYRNPGIMTARAALLALALCPAMEDYGRIPTSGLSWPQERARLIERFTGAYQAIEEPVTDADDAPVPLRPDHKRALVQLRLNLALLVPGHSLVATEPFDPCLEPDPLDDEAVTVMSRWLSIDGNHGNVIGSATMPLFIQSVIALRSLTGSGPGYLAWRHDWFKLGRYANQAGRPGRVEAALREAASRPSLRVSTE
jgi:hypothetical protein